MVDLVPLVKKMNKILSKIFNKKMNSNNKKVLFDETKNIVIEYEKYHIDTQRLFTCDGCNTDVNIYLYYNVCKLCDKYLCISCYLSLHKNHEYLTEQ